MGDREAREQWHGQTLHSPRRTGMGPQARAGRADLRRGTYLPEDIVKSTICSAGHSGRRRAKAGGQVETNADIPSLGTEQTKARSAKVTSRASVRQRDRGAGWKQSV